MKTVIAILFILHGVIVALQSAGSFNPGPGTANPSWLSWWPTNLGQSWLLSRPGMQGNPAATIAGLIFLLAGAAMIAAGLGLLNVLIPHGWWPSLAVIGAGASLLMLVIYLHPLYAVGLGASLAVLVSILWVHWPEFMSL
jgi:hypothetical protein